jgi:hypothetical protein
MAALATQTRKAARERTAGDETTQLPLDERWQPRTIAAVAATLEEAEQMPLEHAAQNRALCTTRPV